MVQTRPLEPLSRHFASQPVVLNELSHMIDNQWKARSLVYVCLMCIPTLKFYSIRTKGHMRVIGYITSTKKAHLKLSKTLKVCRAKREPALIGNHLVVRQEKTANPFFIRLLVVEILLVVHVLNLSFQLQPILYPDVSLPQLVNT
jgi:hypothetical protein